MKATLLAARASPNRREGAFPSTRIALEINLGIKLLVPADTVTGHMLSVVAALKEHKCRSAEVQRRVAASRAVVEQYDGTSAGVDGRISCRRVIIEDTCKLGETHSVRSKVAEPAEDES